MALLLERMGHLSLAERQAYFYCAMVFVNHADDPTPFIATGKLNGEIALNPAGSQGFGYDPIFYLPDYACTAAELPAEVKNRISHRAQALKCLLLQLNQ
jgi:XTP/dITP diphosphohydrolase